MSETPKCPYCGAEMKVDTVRLTQHNWVGWYHCENCRSVGPSKSNCYTEKDAEESALSAALHRAEPEMRPLTLEPDSQKRDATNKNTALLLQRIERSKRRRSHYRHRGTLGGKRPKKSRSRCGQHQG